jgi:hypothetical protein
MAKPHRRGYLLPVNPVSDKQQEQKREWVRAWQRAGPAMEKLRENELRNVSEDDSVRIFDGLDSPFPPVLRDTSGLVEQQRYFRKLHPRPAK